MPNKSGNMRGMRTYVPAGDRSPQLSYYHRNKKKVRAQQDAAREAKPRERQRVPPTIGRAFLRVISGRW